MKEQATQIASVQIKIDASTLERITKSGRLAEFRKRVLEDTAAQLDERILGQVQTRAKDLGALVASAKFDLSSIFIFEEDGTFGTVPPKRPVLVGPIIEVGPGISEKLGQ